MAIWTAFTMYPLVSSPRAALAATLITASCLLSACSDTGTLSDMPAEKLFAATNFSAAERSSHIQSLEWRLKAVAELSRRSSKVEVRQELIDELCTCVVDQLQDRTTRLQFSIAIDAIKSGGFKKEPDLSRYRSIALQKGMSAQDYALQGREVGNILRATARACLAKFVGA